MSFGMSQVEHAKWHECKYSGQKVSERAILYGMATSPRALPSTRELAVMARISAAADGRGLSQEDLARSAGISQSQVSRLIAGKKPVTLTELLPLLDAGVQVASHRSAIMSAM